MNYKSLMTMTAELATSSKGLNPLTGMRETSAPKTIDCYRFGKTTLLRDSKGEMIQSTETVITCEPVTVGDFIDGHEVRAVQQYREFNGQTAYYEAAL